MVPGPGTTAPATPPPPILARRRPPVPSAPLPTVNLGTTVDGVTTGLGDVIGAVDAATSTDTAEQTVNGLGLDDSSWSAPPNRCSTRCHPAQADVQVGSVPLGPLGATPPARRRCQRRRRVGRPVGGRRTGRTDLGVGGPSGVQASAPSAADLGRRALPVANLAGPLLAAG